MGLSCAQAAGLLAVTLLAVGAGAQPADDLITVLPEFDGADWRNLTFFAGASGRPSLAAPNWQQ